MTCKRVPVQANNAQPQLQARFPNTQGAAPPVTEQPTILFLFFMIADRRRILCFTVNPTPFSRLLCVNRAFSWPKIWVRLAFSKAARSNFLQKPDYCGSMMTLGSSVTGFGYFALAPVVVESWHITKGSFQATSRLASQQT
ncbi:hypothetical protein PspLS_11357 [Pyricularia sp. CBS 133598]|nr:hypothetical protein PspLS_11357 [Pyricularia sp. CBS 133598]